MMRDLIITGLVSYIIVRVLTCKVFFNIDPLYIISFLFISFIFYFILKFVLRNFNNVKDDKVKTVMFLRRQDIIDDVKKEDNKKEDNKKEDNKNDVKECSFKKDGVKECKEYDDKKDDVKECKEYDDVKECPFKKDDDVKEDIIKEDIIMIEV